MRRWYEVTVRFSRGKPFRCDVKCHTEAEARREAVDLAVKNKRTELISTVKARLIHVLPVRRQP